MSLINLINSTLSYNESTLCLNNHPLDEYKDKFSTPFYLYDLKIFEDNYDRFFKTVENKINNFMICYAVKSNDHKKFLKKTSDLGSGADVVSIGELEKCLEAKIPPEKIVFSGVGKTDEEIESAIIKCNGRLKSINVESLDELKSIISIADNLKRQINICLRLNPDSPGDTHEHISTGGAHHKFGLQETEVHEGIKLLKSSKHVTCLGLSMHIGSQLTSMKETLSALQLIKKLFNLYPHLKLINIGGGLGIHYDPNSEKLCSLDEYVSVISTFINESKFTDKEIVFEPGRFLSGNSGVLITKVIREKRFFRIVDAGMNDLIRPALYGAHHEIFPIKTPNSAAKKNTLTIAGPICETGDFFIDRKPCYQIRKGDFVAISNTGAYGKVLASTYNSRPLIKEYFIES